ncbi:type IV pilus biosynthesis protein [Caballeronia calidae]|uniref:Type IV pilus biosynthesis protein n=1 Tax=Caballeronia calidae TaxID=1777139 RepID=A0A158EEB0_9BURK|nr:shufflon system plasmid conjugative transfer pilus tip adhesin PilV [Caballeronia calidae]SAL05229.1 type IV pilus biosynthesis protein [Caballeronia calidae]
MVSFIATLVSIVISMLMFTGFVQWAQAGVANVMTAAAASQQVVIDKAAQQYVQDNGLTIAALATASTPTTISAQTLINAGYLPSGFSTTNVFGQLWQLQVLQPSSGVLQSVVFSTGGRAISDTRHLVQIAAQAGAQGGFVPYAGQNGSASMSASNAYGAYGAWTVPLTGFTNPGSGHLFSLLAFTNTQTNNSYLYRVQVANHPELNEMQTDLGMTDTGGTKHNVTGAATVTADTLQNSGGGQLNSDQGGSLELGGNNSQAGAGTPYVDFHLAGQGVQDYNARIINDSNNHLTITAANGQAALGVQGTIQPGSIASPDTYCSTNGQAAANADGSGQWLSCQYHQWLPIGGRWLRYGYSIAQNGTQISAPTCPSGGSAGVVITPQNFSVDDTAVVNYGVSGSGPWTVYITDGQGSAIGGAEASVGTYCAY